MQWPTPNWVALCFPSEMFRRLSNTSKPQPNSIQPTPCRTAN